MIALTVWSYRYFGKYSPFASLINQQDDTLSQIGLTIDDAHVSVRSGGHPVLAVAAREVTYSRDHRIVTIDGLHDGVLFDKNARPRIRFDAGQLVYDTPSGEISTTAGATVLLTGGVHATTVSNGTQISTDSFDWNAAKNELHAPGSVDIVFPRGSGTATATSVVFNTQTHDLTAGRIHGTLRASKLVQ